MAGPFDPFTPEDPAAGMPNLAANPAALAALLSGGLSLMAAPAWGATPTSQIASAIGAGGESVRQSEKLQQDSEAADAKTALAEAKATAAEARAGGAGARADTAAGRLALEREKEEGRSARNALGNKVRLANLYQNYVKDVAKRNAEPLRPTSQAPEPVLPIADWVSKNPMLNQLGLVPQAAATGAEEDDALDSTPTPTGAVPPPGQRVTGQTYSTPKGPMKWTGTGWVP